MKATPIKVRSKSNIDSTDEIQMSFDVEGQAKLAAILIDLYSDLWSAIIREYSANGWDSHVSAGQTRPIEVMLPTLKDPNFRVKDYGVGMSLADIRDIYSKYGASTKDDDNGQIGAYGLGCKSALSVSPAFTVIAIKDGIKNVVIVSREENSLGKITPVAQVETTEENGVEISIVADCNPHEFAEKAQTVFFTWPKGSVLIDGMPPKRSMYDSKKYLHLGNDAYMSHEKEGYNNHVESGLLINMGGIGYPVTASQYETLIKAARRIGSVAPGHVTSHHLILTVPLGSVDLVPSREGIRWSQKSTDTVAQKLKETLGLIVSTLQAKLDVITDRAELFNPEILGLGRSFSPYFVEGDLKWNGEKFPGTLKFEEGPLTGPASVNCVMGYHNSRRSRSYYGMEFNFGFNDHYNRSLEVKTDKTQRNHSSGHWIFIQCGTKEVVPSEMHNHVKSFAKAKGVNTGNVNAVYIVDDLLTRNKWLEAALTRDDTNLFSVTVDELIEASKEYRREQSRLNRLATKGIETRYSLSMVKEINSYKQRIETTMTISELQDALDKDDTLQIFADEVVFTTANKEKEGSAAFFLPENVIVVYMRGARKADTFAKKASFPVRTDLAEFLAEAMISKIEETEFEDFFYELHLGHDLCTFGSKLKKLPEGFLKSIFARKNSGRGNTRLILQHMNNIKEMEGTVFPEIPYVVKGREIVEAAALFFEDGMPWNLDSRSAAYKKQIEAYLGSVSDTIDKIVSK